MVETINEKKSINWDRLSIEEKLAMARNGPMIPAAELADIFMGTYSTESVRDVRLGTLHKQMLSWLEKQIIRLYETAYPLGEDDGMVMTDQVGQDYRVYVKIITHLTDLGALDKDTQNDLRGRLPDIAEAV